MDRKLDKEDQEELIAQVSRVVSANMLNTQDALDILNVLERAIKRENAELEETMLAALIEGIAEDDDLEGEGADEPEM